MGKEDKNEINSFLHPITIVMNEAISIFKDLGFAVELGPELEDDWHNFGALNFPDNHPARDMQDTFFIKGEKGKVLRTHTSNTQIRFMESLAKKGGNPPFAIVVPGKVFRNEATDSTHEMQFYQIEGLMVGEDISVAHMKGILLEFFKRFFLGEEVDIRLRPSFFPFVEPGFEIDLKRGDKWIELLGAGMVHPSVLKNCNIDGEKYQGFAFGIGLDRLMMMKLNIPDVRLSYLGDLRINQFQKIRNKMKVSYKWLKRYIEDIPKEEDLVNLITFKICELEGMEKLGDGDTIFDMNVLPDRAHDLLSHRGIAREIASILGLKLKDEGKEKIENIENTLLDIKIESPYCNRYMGRVIKNIEVGPSPLWLSSFLENIGSRSINNIVDITNFILFDLGQPIHAFDLDKLKNQNIIIRESKDGEIVNLLASDSLINNRNLKLNEGHLVIADEDSILALAGVKGGIKAEIDKNTKNILIEVANFDASKIRKTAKFFNIQTDAVKRFENEIHSNLCDDAMDKLSNLIKEICPIAVFGNIVDVYQNKKEDKKITFSREYISKILGLEIKDEEIEKILKNYNYLYILENNNYIVSVPDYRIDLNIPADMAEEIGRVYGYEKIIPILPRLGLEESDNDTWIKISLAKMQLNKDGYREVMTYAFTDKGEVEVMASASDKNFLRTNLTDGLKKSYELNRLNAPFLKLNEIKIFEIGTIFKKDKEEMHVAWNEKKEFKEMKLDNFVKEKDLLNSELNSFFSCPRVGFARTRPFEKTLSSSFPQKFKMWSLFPFIVRDIALWVPEDTNSKEVEDVIKNEINELVILGPYLFDEFKKDGRISYAFRLIFQSYERTLTDLEVNEVMNKINSKLKENKNWEIR